MTDDLVYTPKRFPHGLRCGECHRLFEPGERYSQRLESMAEFAGDPALVVLLVCVPCGIKGAVTA